MTSKISGNRNFKIHYAVKQSHITKIVCILGTGTRDMFNRSLENVQNVVRYNSTRHETIVSLSNYTFGF